MAEAVKENDKKLKAKINKVLPGTTIEKATTGDINEVKKEIEDFIEQKPQGKNVEKKVHAIRDELVARAYGMSRAELNKLRKEFKEIETKHPEIGTKKAEQIQQMENIRNYKIKADSYKEENTYNKWHTGRTTVQIGTNIAAVVAAAIAIATGAGAGLLLTERLTTIGTATLAAIAASKIAKQGINKNSQLSANEEESIAKYNEGLTEIMVKIKNVDKEIQKNMKIYQQKSEQMKENEFRAYLINELTDIFTKNGIYLEKNTNQQSDNSLELCSAMGG